MENNRTRALHPAGPGSSNIPNPPQGERIPGMSRAGKPPQILRACLEQGRPVIGPQHPESLFFCFPPVLLRFHLAHSLTQTPRHYSCTVNCSPTLCTLTMLNMQLSTMCHYAAILQPVGDGLQVMVPCHNIVSRLEQVLYLCVCVCKEPRA